MCVDTLHKGDNDDDDDDDDNKLLLLLLIINRQDTQWAYNVTLRHGRAKIFTMEKQ
jgi:hypothetical protein